LQKLDDKWRGPFRIVRNVGSAAYELEMPEGWRGHRVFNRDRLKPFIEPKYDLQKQAIQPPSLELVKNFEEY
jgi:hypothetical protein